MKQFFSFVRKEFYHIIRDVRTLIVLLIMPIVQILLFGFALSTEIKDVKMGALVPSSDLAVSRILTQMDASPYFTYVSEFSSPDEMDDAFEKGLIDIALVFDGNFYHRITHGADASIQIVADGSNTNTATMATYYASSIISSFQKEMLQEQMISTGNADVSPPVIDVTSRMLYNPTMKSAFSFVPGVMGMILMLVCALMTSVAIVREKERGTMEVLLVSPVRPLGVIFAKTIPYMLVSIVNLVTIILLSVYMLHVPVSGSLGWLIVVSLIFIIVSLSMGIFISTLVSMQSIAMIISGMVLMLPTMLLSGMLFPIESMPEVLQVISWTVPARWYITCVRSIMIQGLDITYVLKEVLILCGFAVVFVAASLLNFKDRLKV